MTIRIFDGKWLLSGGQLATDDTCCCDDEPPECSSDEDCTGGYCCDGVCQDEPCAPTGACCANDGTCSEVSEAACLAAGGTWQGANTSCNDYDCASGCCESVTIGVCSVLQCTRGYNASTCLTQCDPDADTLGDIVPDCEDGQPTDVTVTGAGYVMSTGDAAFDAAVEALINDSYAVTLSCTGSATEQFETADAFIDVSVGMAASRQASILVLWKATSAVVASMALTASAEASTNTACGSAVYPCGDYSGTVTSYGGLGDGSTATIDVQGV